MRKKQTTIFITGFLLLGSMLACKLPGGTSVSENRADQFNADSDKTAFAATPKPSAVDCPKATLSVDETKNKALANHIGCVLSVRGKMWEVVDDKYITLIDTTADNASLYTLSVSGDFSDDAYYKIGRNISDIRFKRTKNLPVATFTCAVKKIEDYDALVNCVLTDVEKTKGEVEDEEKL